MSAEGRDRLKVLILQHEEPTPPGHVTAWLAEHDAEVDTWRIDVDDRDVDPRDYDLIVSLGSEFAAFDDTKPFVVREASMLETAVAEDVPVLGLCFGGQMLARALGARGFRHDEAEIGWLPVRTSDAKLVPEGPWFQWHFDSFTVPPGATVVANTDVGPQAFVAGRSLGLQFHPEVTTEIMDDWVRVYRHELDGDGVDPDALLEETHRIADESRGRAWQLFERFLHDVAGVEAPHVAEADADRGAGG
jgi:GMP synthase-like glutamine amidotransferase